MSTKIQTSSALIFDKLSGTPYEDGSLTTDLLDFDSSIDGTGKKVTPSTALFDKLSGVAYEDGSIRHNIGALVQKTGPRFVQEGIENDLANIVSVTTAGTFAAKSIFDEHLPYVIESEIIIFNSHFIAEVRRQLSGEIEFSGFSPEEQVVYDNFVPYVMGEPYDYDITILALLDFWLVEEIQGNEHPEVTVVYADDHPWKKLLLTREI